MPPVLAIPIPETLYPEHRSSKQCPAAVCMFQLWVCTRTVYACECNCETSTTDAMHNGIGQGKALSVLAFRALTTAHSFRH